MTESESPLSPERTAELHALRQEEMARNARKARAHHAAAIGTELMTAFNRGKTDPSDLAVLGHDSIYGFEFCIERDGVAYTISVSRDWDT